MPYQLQTNPFIVPTTDGKLIAEHEGLATTGNGNISIARMVAPPHWGEPFQTPLFDEYTLVSRGKKMVEADGEQLIINAGESILKMRKSPAGTAKALAFNAPPPS